MKKQALFLLLLLGTATTAWGSFACVTVDPAACPCGETSINIQACLPYDCELAAEPTVCVRGSMIIVDICYECEDCECGGCTPVDEDVEVALCPGSYSVLVRVSVDCDDWAFGPRVSAIGSAFFKTGPCNPCWPWDCVQAQ